MTRRTLAILLAVPIVAAAQGATGTLMGRVLDAQSGAPLASAELVLAQKRATTDSTGAYRFTEVPGGVHVITVRRLGYELLNQNIAVFVGAESESDFRLKRVTRLDTITTKAEAPKYTSPGLRGFEERRKTGVGYFIDEATLRKSDDRTLGKTLKRIAGMRVYLYQAGEFVSSSRRNGSGQAGSLLGRDQSQPQRADPSKRDSPRGCWVSVYVDGLAIFTGSPHPAPDISRYLVRDLAGIEFYQGTASMPAQFATVRPTDCGVLLLWTRER